MAKLTTKDKARMRSVAKKLKFRPVNLPESAQKIIKKLESGLPTIFNSKGLENKQRPASSRKESVRSFELQKRYEIEKSSEKVKRKGPTWLKSETQSEEDEECVPLIDSPKHKHISTRYVTEQRD